MDGPEDREQRQHWLKELPSHRLAFRDWEFIDRADMRSFRLALEYLKPQVLQREAGVKSTIVVFGSARTPSPERVEGALEEARERVEENPDDEDAQAELQRVESRCRMVRYYEEARKFGALVSRYNQTEAPYEFVITTGGGPGIMEAANRGAAELGLKTMGLNIEIPHEQVPNPYISSDLCFNFHYFALRKMHFLLKARALVIFPGGFGTLDELFDALTLIQTGKMERIPIVMFGREYWSGVLSFEALAEAGTIGPDDVDLFTWADSAEEAWKEIREFYEDGPGADSEWGGRDLPKADEPDSPGPESGDGAAAGATDGEPEDA